MMVWQVYAIAPSKGNDMRAYAVAARNMGRPILPNLCHELRAVSAVRPRAGRVSSTESPTAGGSLMLATCRPQA